MPYIKREDRYFITDRVNALSEMIRNDGDLNYAISLLIHKQLDKRGVNYANMNNLVGAMECAKNEFIRTVMGPYEDKKRLENGSVSKLDEVEQG
jgi:hypothetical protein